MDKRLKEYIRYIDYESDKLSQTKDKGDEYYHKLKRIAAHHRLAVKNFQHERLVHLFVTLFFGGAFITIFLFYLGQQDMPQVLHTPLVIIIGMLGITTVFYIHHYYRLENGVQRLYQYSKKLFELSK